LKATGRKFKETLIELRRPDTRAKILKHSPAGLVPILKHGPVTVWESLAICEYLAEIFPAAGLWPANLAARAAARCAATEMHGGFAPLRAAMSMDVKLRHPTPPMTEALKADIARVTRIWNDSRRDFGAKAKGAASGPFLFGLFSIADCMYAPVTTRFTTYGVAVDPVSTAYIEAVAAWPAMREWIAAA
ncbi:MAG: glutathione S-transferase, partial [Rhodospirillales bacterium]